jgi:hypothetical protein
MMSGLSVCVLLHRFKHEGGDNLALFIIRVIAL